MKNGKLKELRKKKGLTLLELAELIGTSKQTIHRYETGVISNIPGEKIELLAAALDTTPSELMGWDEDIRRVSSTRLPLLGKIACGTPVFANEEHESFIPCGDELGADFCLMARGDSMTGARIFDGDIVFIRSQESVEDGEIAAVVIGDEATLKRVYYYPDEAKLVLMPENPKHAPLVYVGEELSEIRILGRAVAFQSKII